MPCASAPKAPCVEVWLSPQTMVVPGSVKPCSGPIDVHDALALIELVVVFDAEVACAFLASVSTWMRLSSSLMPWLRSEVGMLWSTTASVFSGARTLRPARRRPSNACGLVTSCTRWRSI